MHIHCVICLFQEIVPTLEELHFPQEWRALFTTAGVPQTALDDVDATRTLISIVTRTLDTLRGDRPPEVPALTLYDSDDDDGGEGSSSGEKEKQPSGKLYNMDWETDSDTEDDASDEDESFRQLQYEVQEAAARYRGAVGTARTDYSHRTSVRSTPGRRGLGDGGEEDSGFQDNATDGMSNETGASEGMDSERVEMEMDNVNVMEMEKGDGLQMEDTDNAMEIEKGNLMLNEEPTSSETVQQTDSRPISRGPKAHKIWS